MIQRCYNPNNTNYKNYGNRGISVCEEWHHFEVFYDWAVSNGYDDTLTLDRIDVDKNYSPDNCRWATSYEQANNKRSNRFIEYMGERKTVKEWADSLGVPVNRIRSRLSLGWSIEDALTKPRQS